MEKIKNDLQIKKGRFSQDNQKTDNLSAYEFERIYLDWAQNKGDIISSMLSHATTQEEVQLQDTPIEKVERVSKKQEAEEEVQQLFSNYKNKKRGI